MTTITDLRDSSKQLQLRELDEPLFINSRTTTPAIVPQEQGTFSQLGRSFPEQAERLGAIQQSVQQKSFEPLFVSLKGQAERVFGKGYGLTSEQAVNLGMSAGLSAPVKAFKVVKDLTTKFLEHIKGKTTLSKQEITDFARRPELKKGEADLLNRLGSEIKENKVPAQEFADSIQRDLLPLKPVKVKDPQYKNISISRDERFPGSYRDKFTGKNYEEVVFESPIVTNGSSHYSNSKNYFAHARGDEVLEGGKKIWREQEIQSDLLQKEGIEQLRTNAKYAPETHGVTVEQVTKLDPFTNDRFGERIMRERIKDKAKKGYSKYRLPTGETIGKIEGFDADKSNPQYARYEKWGKFLKNKFKGKEVTDRQGNTWTEIDLNKGIGRLPIEAFGIAPIFLTNKTKSSSEDQLQR